MGRYMNELRQIQEQHDIMTRTHSRIMDMYGAQMDDYARSWNETRSRMDAEVYQRDVARLIPLVQKEMVEEIRRDVLKSLEVQVTDKASPALKSLNQELDKLFTQGRRR